MKHVARTGLITLLLAGSLAACNSETDKPQTTTPAAEKAAEAEKKKTEISVGPDGAGVKTRSGDEVRVNKDGSSVETKDVKIKLNTKDTTKKQ